MTADRLLPFAGEPVRLLLVEGQEARYRHTRDMLARARHVQFTIDWAQTLAAALARLHEGAFDAMVISQQLPDGEGLELVRAAQSHGRAAPAIMLADQATLELDLQAMALGVSDFLDRGQLDGSLLERTIRYALARRRQAERLSHLAQHDELTGLANRALFQDRFERALAWARRRERMVAVMVLDLNGFKAVNDRLGHAAGDRLLCIVAQRLVQRLRETDTVARLGGDEYALVIENLAKAEHAALVARKLLDAVAPAVAIGDCEVTVTASLGVALYPKDGEDTRSLLAGADAAMYRAKAEGGNLCRFSSAQLERRVQRGAILESDIRRGLAQGEFVLHFQPQVTLNSDELGISGLIRWCHPELGLIGAERFLPLAEDTGLLEPLTDWLFEAGCAQVQRWQRLELGKLHLALPLLSRQQLAWNDLGRRLTERLDERRLGPDWLEIELTEELLLGDAEAGGVGLGALKRLGVRLALDGFGRGPTSLRGLQLGVLDTLKLSRELLEGVPQQAQRTALTKAIIGLARDLHLRVVAEGVDHQEQLSFLRQHGCSGVQAFMSCPPLPAEACTGWLRQAAGRRERPRPVPASRHLPPPAAPLPAEARLAG